MHAGTGRQQAAPAWGDGFTALALAAGTLLYLSQWPYNLGSSDEGLYLYQSKRILEGEVFFRDIFDIIPPGAHYLMAAAFGVFGTTMTTARAVNALMHAAIVVCIYASARVAGARIVLALIPPFAHLALCQSAWPFASPHWLSSTLTMGALLLALRGGWRDHRWITFALGVIIGLLIAVQQQRGVLIAAAMNGLAFLLRRRTGRLPLGMQLGFLNAGVATVLVPFFALLAVQAGVQPIVYALIQHTMVNYRQHHRTGWGSVPILTAGYAAYTFPLLLKCLPAILLIEGAVAFGGWWSGSARDAVQPAITLIVFGIAAALSIAYFPDFIHIGFIAAIFLIAAVEVLDRGLRRLPAGTAWGGTIGVVIAVGVLAALAIQLERNLARSQREFPVTADTAFGRIAFSDGSQPGFVETTERLLRGSPSREMFTYPYYASLYLMTGTKNPTPYQFVDPHYSGPARIQEVIGILEARRVPLVFAFHAFVPKDDAIMAYLREHYVPADTDQLFWTRRSG